MILSCPVRDIIWLGRRDDKKRKHFYRGLIKDIYNEVYIQSTINLELNDIKFI